MINEVDYVELGLACAKVCNALHRGMSGKRPDELSQSVLEAIGQLTEWVGPAVDIRGIYLQVTHRRAVTEIRTNIFKQGKRNVISRRFHARNDKETITSWRLDLNRILHIFNVRSSTSG